MKTILFTLFLLISFSACQSDKSKSLEEKIRGEDYKYWLYIKSFPEEESLGLDSDFLYLSYFDKNGKYLLFFKSTLLEDLEQDSDVPDIIESDSWKVSKDSVFTINEFSSLIIKEIDDNMMLLYHPIAKRYNLYIAAPESLIPEKYRCIQK